MKSTAERVDTDVAKLSEAKQRILDAAAEAFALKGFEATTIREITDAAGANVAAVNYHFGSKANLLRAVLASTLGPLNDARSNSLDQIVEMCGAAGPSVPELLHALLQPLVTSRRSLDGGRTVIRLLQQMRVGPVDLTSRLLSEQFDAVATRYIAALGIAAPQFTRQEIIWRYEFVRGAAMQVLGDTDPRSGRLLLLALGDDITVNDTILLTELVRFAAAGFGVASHEIDAALSATDQAVK